MWFETVWQRFLTNSSERTSEYLFFSLYFLLTFSTIFDVETSLQNFCGIFLNSNKVYAAELKWLVFVYFKNVGFPGSKFKFFLPNPGHLILLILTAEFPHNGEANRIVPYPAVLWKSCSEYWPWSLLGSLLMFHWCWWSTKASSSGPN